MLPEDPLSEASIRQAPDNGALESRIEYKVPRRRPYWLNALLFFLTLISTTVVGARLAENFRLNKPAVYLAEDLSAYQQLLANPASWLDGLVFSLALMAILLAHEMGHYVTCTRYGLDASLPYFMPFPSLIGTLGAFIRIRSPIYTRRALFDVGMAGPLVGFALTLPVTVAGIASSRIVPGIASLGDLNFGTPPLFWLFESLLFPGATPADISLHPVARAAWVGVFATALNLLPIGQLDGGHILYSFFPDKHRILSRLFVLTLVPLGIFYWPWLVWAAILFFFGLRHPAIVDATELGRRRKILGIVALAIFLLCFMVAPIETGSVQ